MLSPPDTEWRASDYLFRRRDRSRLPPERGGLGGWWDDERHTLVKPVLIALGVAAAVPVLVLLILYADYRSMLPGSLPPEKQSVVSSLTRVYDDAGNQIALLRQFDVNIPVKQQDIPTVLKQATVAAEDRRFYSHGAVDDHAIVRAIWADLTGGGYVEGASTITQQYVRLMYLTDERTLHRKLKEAALARRVEKEMSKDEILYRYLDRVYLGGGAYGVGAAAQSYFHKSVNDLSLSESALLAGLIRQPSVDEPRSNSAGAEEDRMRVLGQMLDQHRITQAQYDDAAAQHVYVLEDGDPMPDGPATVIYPPQEQQAQYPFFVDYVRRYLIAKYGEDAVYKGGLQVYTSLDPSLQAKAEAAVNDTLKGTSPPIDMALVSVDPRTGLVRALIGGRDWEKSQVNLALGHCADAVPPKDGEPICVDGGGSGRQGGSSFKPFTLAKAFEKGMGPTKVYYAPYVYTFPNCSGNGCTVHNVEGEVTGSLTLRQATAYSVNTVFAQLINDVGVKDVAELAHRVGLTMINPDGKLPDGEPYGPSLTLGAAEVSPLDMAAAYGVFANRGLQLPASPVIRVEKNDGTMLEDNRNRRGRQVVTQTVADNVNDVLKDVVAYGTGVGADIGHPDGTAGKTGTAEDYSDAWYIGYTPELSTAIWMGDADAQRPLVNIKGASRVYGATFGVPTWHNYMAAAAPELNLTDFVKPGVLPTAPPSTSPGGQVSTPIVTTPTTFPYPFPFYTLPAPPPTLPPLTLPPLPTTPTTLVSPTSIYRAPPTTLPSLPTTPTTRYSRLTLPPP
jgi:penicillin-binding protein 1A